MTNDERIAAARWLDFKRKGVRFVRDDSGTWLGLMFGSEVLCAVRAEGRDERSCLVELVTRLAGH